MLILLEATLVLRALIVINWIYILNNFVNMNYIDMSPTMNRKLLELHPNTIQDIRKLYGLEDPKKIEEAIDILNDWIQKQNHFTEKVSPKKYLEMSIINSKGSIERAKQKIENLCTLRTVLPKFYNFTDVKDRFKDLFTYTFAAPLPKLTEDHCRIFIVNLRPSELFLRTPFTDYCIIFLIFCEYASMYDYCNGYTLICDYREMKVTDLISKFNPVEFKQLMTLVLDGYGMRLRSLRILTNSKTMEILLNMMKAVVPSKIANRYHLHTNMDSLYEHVPKDILPTEFGGTSRSLRELQSEWVELLNSKESLEYLNWTKKARVNESYRLPEKYTELTGTFRSISID